MLCYINHLGSVMVGVGGSRGYMVLSAKYLVSNEAPLKPEMYNSSGSGWKIGYAEPIYQIKSIQKK